MSVSAARPGPKRNIIEGTILGVVLTGLSYLVGLKVGWVQHLDWLEVFAVFTSYVCTYLCVTERRINYPIGAVSTAAYAILFYRSDLLGSALLNAYLTPQLVYGWFRWRKDVATRPVTRVGLKWWPVYIAASVGAYFGAAKILDAFGGTLAFLDTLVLVGSILAQWLLDNKKIENWIIWAGVNVVAIIDYTKVGLHLAAFQYVFFLLNTFYGFYMWNRSRRAQSVRPTDGIAPDERALAASAVR